MRIVLLTTLLLVVNSGCFQERGASRVQTKTTDLDHQSFVMTRKPPAGIETFGGIEKVVKLETREESLIGEIDRIKIDSETGDIYIGDYHSTGEFIDLARMAALFAPLAVLAVVRVSTLI